MKSKSILDLKDDELEETIGHLESALESIHTLFKYMPAPVILYTSSGIVAWCNHPMLNLFWGTRPVPEYTEGKTIFGRHVKEVMPEYLWPYVIEQNNSVLEKEVSQYEEWSDERWVGIKWKCLRFPAGDSHVGVILFPEDESHLAVCDAAIKIKR